MEPKVMDDPVIRAIAQRVHLTPAQVALAWAVERGCALLTTSINPEHIRQNFAVSHLPPGAMSEMREGIETHVRFNAVVQTWGPGFVPAIG